MPVKPDKFICDGCQKPFKHQGPDIEMREVKVVGGAEWKNVRFCSAECCQFWVRGQQAKNAAIG